MKIFEDEKECIEYLGVNNQYFDDELSNFLGCNGSEIFDSKDKISYDNFKYHGFDITSLFNNKQYEVFVASVKIDEDDYKDYYCIVEK